MKKLALAITAFALYLIAGAQSWQDTVIKIEKIFERYKAARPGVLAVGRNGSVIFSKAWGMADLEHGVPLTTESITEKTLNHKPGDEFLYSNSNYNLFAIIIQRVSGMSLADFTRKNIFEPAGMNHTQWRDNYKRIVPDRAIAYSKTGSTYQTNMPNEYVYGNGGLLTTAEDLLKWCNYYLNGKLGVPSLLEKLHR